jgi:HEPN domain-containing protein
MTPLVRLLMKKAEDDWKVANDEAATAAPVWEAVGFHYQQCLEKLLKAYLVVHDFQPPRVHDLSYLLRLCSQFDPRFSACVTDSLILLDECAVNLRYEETDEITSAMMISAGHEARLLRQMILEVLVTGNDNTMSHPPEPPC